MELDLYIRKKGGYELRTIIPESGANFSFFKSLLNNVDNELNNIRSDIISYFDDPTKVNLKKPRHEDYDIQKKINILKKIRKTNLNTKEQIKYLLSGNEFIICENCKGKMFKVPIGVKYEKVNNKIILKETPYVNTKYIYVCENDCPFMVDEECYEKMKNHLNRREELLQSGSKFIPGKFGFYYYS